MTISERYNLSDIVLKIETVLQIDGRDYGERDVSIIMDNIYKRMARQYGLELADKKLTDEELYIGTSREKAFLLLDNIAQLHAQLSGYTQLIRYKSNQAGKAKNIEVRGRNISYFGASQNGFTNFIRACMFESQVNSVEQAFDFMISKFGTISKCMEKRMLLIMIVARKFGLHELVSCIAEIFLIGELV